MSKPSFADVVITLFYTVGVDKISQEIGGQGFKKKND